MLSPLPVVPPVPSVWFILVFGMDWELLCMEAGSSSPSLPLLEALAVLFPPPPEPFRVLILPPLPVVPPALSVWFILVCGMDWEL